MDEYEAKQKAIISDFFRGQGALLPNELTPEILRQGIEDLLNMLEGKAEAPVAGRLGREADALRAELAEKRVRLTALRADLATMRAAKAEAIAEARALENMSLNAGSKDDDDDSGSKPGEERAKGEALALLRELNRLIEGDIGR